MFAFSVGRLFNSSTVTIAKYDLENHQIANGVIPPSHRDDPLNHVVRHKINTTRSSFHYEFHYDNHFRTQLRGISYCFWPYLGEAVLV